MPFYYIKWSQKRIRHLEENGVTPNEFAEVIASTEKETTSRSSGRPAILGYTRSGRRLFVVFDKLDQSTIEPITAYDV